MALDDDFFGPATISLEKSRYPHNGVTDTNVFLFCATVGFVLIPSPARGLDLPFTYIIYIVSFIYRRGFLLLSSMVLFSFC